MGIDGCPREGNAESPWGPTHLLPLVRAAMARGDGPAAVPAWLRFHGYKVGRRVWTNADEILAKVLAHRLAATIDTHRLNTRGTVRLLETVS